MEIKYINNKIDMILDLINHNSLNYDAEIQIFPAIPSAGRMTSEIVKEVLGLNAVVRSTSSSNEKEVLNEFIFSLS